MAKENPGAWGLHRGLPHNRAAEGFNGTELEAFGEDQIVLDRSRNATDFRGPYLYGGYYHLPYSHVSTAKTDRFSGRRRSNRDGDIILRLLVSGIVSYPYFLTQAYSPVYRKEVRLDPYLVGCP